MIYLCLFMFSLSFLLLIMFIRRVYEIVIDLYFMFYSWFQLWLTASINLISTSSSQTDLIWNIVPTNSSSDSYINVPCFGNNYLPFSLGNNYLPVLVQLGGFFTCPSPCSMDLVSKLSSQENYMSLNTCLKILCTYQSWKAHLSLLCIWLANQFGPLDQWFQPQTFLMGPKQYS